MGSDTIAVAVDRRDGPAFIEDRPYGRPIRSSPWPWPITPSRRAASPATTASRSESHRQGGLDTRPPVGLGETVGRCDTRWPRPAWLAEAPPCVDPSGVIRVHTLTEETGDDATLALDRLTAVKGPLARVTADAASDTVAIDETARARGATVVVPPARTATVSGHGPRSPARDRTIPLVKDARPVPLEAGVRVPSSGPGGEHVLPRHVHHRRWAFAPGVQPGRGVRSSSAVRS